MSSVAYLLLQHSASIACNALALPTMIDHAATLQAIMGVAGLWMVQLAVRGLRWAAAGAVATL